MVDQALSSLVHAFHALIWPALIFGGLSLIIKGRECLRSLKRCSAETGVNLTLLAIDAVLVLPVLAFITTGIAGAADRFGLIASIDWAAFGPLPAALAAVLLGDLIGYWRHRLEHSRVLWPAHAVHHSDTAMTWLTLMRFHPINRLTTAVIDSTVLLALGFPVWAVVVNNMIRHWYGFLIHADLPWTFGLFGRIFVSPAMHRWHHVSDEALAGKNFATVFVFWDVAFGTHYLPGVCRAPLGVHSGKRNAFSQLAHPFRTWFAALARRPSASTVRTDCRASAIAPSRRAAMRALVSARQRRTSLLPAGSASDAGPQASLTAASMRRSNIRTSASRLRSRSP